MRQLCRDHFVMVKADSNFQRCARLLQALWREENDHPIGTNCGAPIGSRIAMPYAQATLSNYLSENIRNVVRAEVLDPEASRDKKYGAPRIFDNLLSSQPLCFNLFAELKRDLRLATRLFSRLFPTRVRAVTRMEFEHSPGRRDPRYLADRTAFDVYFEFEPPAGGRGFAGIEVKYHENLDDKEAGHKQRYDEVARLMGVFRDPDAPSLRRRPLEQIWRDHLLAGSLRLADGFDDAFSVFLHPEDNDRCHDAATGYLQHLTSAESFLPLTLEEVVGALKGISDSEWVKDVESRYLAFGKIEEHLAGMRP